MNQMNPSFPEGEQAFLGEDWRKMLGPTDREIREMLSELGFDSIDSFVQALKPAALNKSYSLELPDPISQRGVLEQLLTIGSANKRCKSFIGLGFYNTATPPVVQKHVLENPAWYTPYTPYQAEISQGRLEALMNFQTMVIDLTGMEIANASMLDEATAVVEAMLMCKRILPERNRFIASPNCHPQIIHVLNSYARACEIELEIRDPYKIENWSGCIGVAVQYPDTYGAVTDLEPLVQKAHKGGALVVVIANPMALAILKPPGEFGADIVVGSVQCFGLPLGYGGPHAGFFSTKREFLRQMPGRLVGLSKDRLGRPAFRLALQTREQHIRREKATSNICTAQSLTAIAATMYAMYHGPDGLRRIATQIHLRTVALAEKLIGLGYKIHNAWEGQVRLDEPVKPFFDTIVCILPSPVSRKCLRIGWELGVNLRYVSEDAVGITLDETATAEDLETIVEVFSRLKNELRIHYLQSAGASQTEKADILVDPKSPFYRVSPPLRHPIFRSFNSEPALTRYIHQLASKDLGLQHGMIPLGSCTMKLNPAIMVRSQAFPNFADIHPYVPQDQAAGWKKIFDDLERWLLEITGMDCACFQPLSGAHGEFAGLMTIKAFHRSRGQQGRTLCLIPESAHGTNPASAAMAGFKVVPIKCTPAGEIDLDHLNSTIRELKQQIGVLMVTYPSTYGLFDANIPEAIELVHKAGGLVYFDGANLNALLGIAKPGEMGADICHINIHKTFGTPHGGGGPGAGPICAKGFLENYLPKSFICNEIGQPTLECGSYDQRLVGPVSGSPMGNALVYLMAWVYLRLFGNKVKTIGPLANLNANYLASKLGKYFPVAYKHLNGRVAHECIIDLRNAPVSVEDVAKRLIDYGYHAPTMAWPVHGCLMIEPTESEPKTELDRFCKAMEAIFEEIQKVRSGEYPESDNPIKNAPHPWFELVSDQWHHAYSRLEASCAQFFHDRPKFFPPVARVDNVWGDRNPVLYLSEKM